MNKMVKLKTDEEDFIDDEVVQFDGMLEKVDDEIKAWEKFQSSGLLWFTNQFLHVFGYAITFSYNEDKTLKSVYPARVKFRGFNGDSVDRGHKRLSTYIKNNAEALYKEVMED